MATFRYCDKNFACPVCRGHEHCRESADGLVFCRRRNDLDYVPDYQYWRPDPHGFNIWIPERNLNRPRRGDNDYVPPVEKVITHRRNPDSLTNEYNAWLHQAVALTHKDKEEFSKELGLPYSSVSDWYKGQLTWGMPAYSLPEYGFRDDGKFDIVGAHFRRADGNKQTSGHPRIENESKRGLVLLDGWDTGKGPIYLVEGATDSMTLRAMGLSVIGRPNNRAGAKLTARYLREFIIPKYDEPRELIVVGENDLKPDGRWPGKEGGLIYTRELVEELGLPAKFGMMPSTHKDARAWFNDKWPGRGDPLALGPTFEAAIRAEGLQVIRPEHLKEPAAPARIEQPACVAPETSTTAMEALIAFIVSTVGAEPERKEEEAAAAECIRRARACQEEHRCPACIRLFQIDRQTHQPRIIDRRCEKWTCPGCRGYLISRERFTAALRFGQAGSLYEFGCSDADWPNIARRLRTAKASYRRIRDGEGWYVVTSAWLTGAIPASLETVLATWDLHLDEWAGDHNPTSSSRDWGFPEQASEGRFVQIGLVPTDLSDADVEEVASKQGATVRYLIPQGMGAVQRYRMFERRGGWDEESARGLGLAFLGAAEPDIPDDFSWRAASPARPRETTLAEDLAWAS